MLLKTVVVIFAFCAHQVFVGSEVPRKRGFDKYKLYRIVTTDEDELDTLHKLKRNMQNLDFWRGPGNRVGEPTVVLVSPEDQKNFVIALKDEGIKWKVVSKDFQKDINSEAELNDVDRDQKNNQCNSTFGFQKYHCYNEMMAYIQILHQNYPEITELITIGKSFEGRDLLMIKIGKPGSKFKRAMYIDGGIHAREWIASAATMYVVEQFVKNYNTSESIARLLDRIDIYILPLANPDGYEYSRTVDRMWRKTRSLNHCTADGLRCDCAGVDPNRNFPFAYRKAQGQSTDGCSEIYRGPSALSEPETKAIADFLSSRNNLLSYVTVHSYGQNWLVPFGHSRTLDLSGSQDQKDLFDVANSAAAEMKKTTGAIYSVGNSAADMYIVGGASDDYAKGTLHIKYAYTVEVRPNDDDTHFLLPPKEILPTGKELFAGVKVIAEAVSSYRRKF